MRLLEASSLGTAGARQLRGRADASTVAVIRARAYFADSDAGRAWWEANQHSPDALRRRARELADAGDLDLSEVLIRVADDQQNVIRTAQLKETHYPGIQPGSVLRGAAGLLLKQLVGWPGQAVWTPVGL